MKRETIADVVREMREYTDTWLPKSSPLGQQIPGWASRLSAIADQGTVAEVWVVIWDKPGWHDVEVYTTEKAGYDRANAGENTGHVQIRRCEVHGAAAAEPDRCYCGEPLINGICPHDIGAPAAESGEMYDLCETCERVERCEYAVHCKQSCQAYKGPRPTPAKPEYTDTAAEPGECKEPVGAAFWKARAERAEAKLAETSGALHLEQGRLGAAVEAVTELRTIANRTQAEAGMLRDRVGELEESLEDMVDGMKRWGWEEDGIPGMVWSAYRTARTRLGWEEVDEPAPPEHDDGLPKCPKCGRPATSEPGKGHDGSGRVLACKDGCTESQLIRTRDEWIRHCAENTPCRGCGRKPGWNEPDMSVLYCGNYRCDAEGESHTPTEWLKRNEVTNARTDSDAGRDESTTVRDTAPTETDESVATSDALERAKAYYRDDDDLQFVVGCILDHCEHERDKLEDVDEWQDGILLSIDAIRAELDAVKRGEK